MAASEDGFEDWDAEFLDQVIQVEELGLASANTTQHHKPLKSQPLATAAAATADVTLSRSVLPPPQPSQRPPAYPEGIGYDARDFSGISYSPPRQLSQRALDTNVRFAAKTSSVQDLEIERLKTEQGRLSKQRSSLEQECVDLKKERDKLKQECVGLKRERDKLEQHKSVQSDKESSNAKCNRSNTEKLREESPFLVKDPYGISSKCQNARRVGENVCSVYKKDSRTIGIQTEEDSPNCNVKVDQCIDPTLPKKLQLIWSSSQGSALKSFVAKLLEICAVDFCSLFDYLGMDIPCKTMDLEKNSSACMTLVSNIQSHYSVEAAKISKLCTILTKISDGMAHVKALLEVLVDLCCLQNVLMVHRSLRIMHVVLDQLLSMRRKQERSVLYSGKMSRLKSFVLTVMLAVYYSRREQAAQGFLMICCCCLWTIWSIFFKQFP